MNSSLVAGMIIVNLALLFYSIAIITEQRKKILNKTILLFLTFGVIFDITATTFMIIGSSRSGLTAHGLLGYSSLLLMLIDAILLWKLRIGGGYNIAVPHGLHLYSRVAYIWWVLAYITGALIVMMR